MLSRTLWFLLSASFAFPGCLSSGHWTRLREGKIVEAIYGLGSLEAEETFRYRPAVMCRAERVHVKEGQWVKPAQALLRLSEGPVIASPIEGVVTQLDIREHETCFPGTTLITVMNLKKLEISITLEQASALRVRPGQAVRIQFESLTDSLLSGHVRSVYPKDGQFFIRVSFDSKVPTLLPGMTADTAILLGEKSNVLLAPLRAIQRGMILLRSTTGKRKVQAHLGFRDSEFIEISPDPSLGIVPGAEVWEGP